MTSNKSFRTITVVLGVVRELIRFARLRRAVSCSNVRRRLDSRSSRHGLRFVEMLAVIGILSSPWTQTTSSAPESNGFCTR
ncbi:MAG TPA: hypothetical protein VJN22_06410 [Candidatus Eremiobacteraceae bacterium]|nr:hypothetical protein [Candidatus Eremiobacteraceae bacterium]